MSQVDVFIENITNFVFKNKNDDYIRQSNNIRHHTDKLAVFGDFGFPITKQAWYCRRYTDANDMNIIDDSENEFKSTLIRCSASWVLPIERVEIQKFRCLLFLHRGQCFRNVLKMVLYDDPQYGRWQHASNTSNVYDIQLQRRSNENTLTEYRCATLAKVLVNVLKVSGIEVVGPNGEEKSYNERSALEISVTSSSRHDEHRNQRQPEVDCNNNTRRIICGTVKCSFGQTSDEYVQ